MLERDLIKLAMRNIESAEKRAYIPMPGGQMPQPPMPVDPSTGMPVDPAMAGGMPVDPAMAGLPVDPSMMAAGGQPPIPGGALPPGLDVGPQPPPEQMLYDIMVQAVRQVFSEIGMEPQRAAEPQEDEHKPAKKPSVSDRLAAIEDVLMQLGAPIGDAGGQAGFGPGAGAPGDAGMAGAQGMPMPAMGPMGPMDPGMIPSGGGMQVSAAYNRGLNIARMASRSRQ